MARLFIRHQPVDCVVDASITPNVFYLPRHTFDRYGLSAEEGRNNTDVTYVCVVHEGKCYAARSISIMGNKEQRIYCVPFDDDPSAQQMVLTDMILN